MQIELVPDPSLFAIMVIFILNYLVVKTFFLKPINAVLEVREAETRSAEEAYESALAGFREATAKMEAELYAARREASQLRDRFRGEAAARRQQVVDRTNSEARQLVTEAEEALNRQVAEAREKIVREADVLARVAAERILGRAV